MKNLITTLLLISLFACCAPDTQEGKEVQKALINYHDTPRGISVQKIDGCEYVYVETRNAVAICHKENCKNVIHSLK